MECSFLRLRNKIEKDWENKIVKKDWKDWKNKIEKTRLKRQDWKNKIEKTRLKKQDWRTSSSILSIFFNLHQSEKYNKLSISKLKKINKWNIHDYLKTHKEMLINKKVSSFGFQVSGFKFRVFNNQKPQTKNPKPIKI